MKEDWEGSIILCLRACIRQIPELRCDVTCNWPAWNPHGCCVTADGSNGRMREQGEVEVSAVALNRPRVDGALLQSFLSASQSFLKTGQLGSEDAPPSSSGVGTPRSLQYMQGSSEMEAVCAAIFGRPKESLNSHAVLRHHRAMYNGGNVEAMWRRPNSASRPLE